MVLGIIGNKGNMGRRYSACLSYLGIPFVGYDTADSKRHKDAVLKEADRYIVCTPTGDHMSTIRELVNFEKPMLVEKPVVKTLGGLESLLALQKAYRVPIYMVNQYQYLYNSLTEYPMAMTDGHTYYNYFKTGGDGLVWDCIQILYLAKNKNVTLQNTSPIWTCVINGVTFKLNQMDRAYLEMLVDFSAGRKNLWDINDIKAATYKVFNYEEGIDRHSSQERLEEVASKSTSRSSRENSFNLGSRCLSPCS